MKVTTVAWRAWYADVTNGVRRFSGRVDKPIDEVLADIRALPASGIQVVMLYYEQLASTGEPYRRIIAGNDFYYVAPGLAEPIFGQTNREDDVPAGAVVLRGKSIDDATFADLQDEAMSNYEVPT